MCVQSSENAIGESVVPVTKRLPTAEPPAATARATTCESSAVSRETGAAARRERWRRRAAAPESTHPAQRQRSFKKSRRDRTHENEAAGPLAPPLPELPESWFTRLRSRRRTRPHTPTGSS